MKRFIPVQFGDYVNVDMIKYFSVRQVPLENSWYIVAYLNEKDADGEREFFRVSSHFKSEDSAYDYLDNLIEGT